MCLDSIDKTRKVPSKSTVLLGWKIFQTGYLYDKKGILHSECQDPKGVKGYRPGLWYMADVHFIGDSPRYKSGFHTFLNRKAAVSWMAGVEDLCIRKVKLRGVTTIGFQQTGGEDSTVIVAREMLIVPRRRSK